MDLDILQDLALGLKQKEIAIKYDVSPSYVSKVKRGLKEIDIVIPQVHEQIKDLDMPDWIKKQIAYHEDMIRRYQHFANLLKEEE